MKRRKNSVEQPQCSCRESFRTFAGLQVVKKNLLLEVESEE